MEQYISKDAIVAEIEKRIKEISKECEESKTIQFTLIGKINALENLLPFLDTLEVKEEILDKEGKTDLMRKCVHKAYKRGYDMGVLLTTNKIKHNTKEVDSEKESLVWEDIRELYILFAEVDAEIEFCKCDIQAETIGYYQEVLKRFKAQKGE